MSNGLKKFFSDNLDKILTWAFASLTTGATSTLLVKLLGKKIFKNISIGILAIIGIVIISIIYLICYYSRKRKKEALIEYMKILSNIENILELKKWNRFISYANDYTYPFEICDQRDNIKKYTEANSCFWSSKDKKLKNLILETIDSFEIMFKTISEHLTPDPNCQFLYVDKFYKNYYGTPQHVQKEQEFDDYINDSWCKIEEYRNNLNKIVNYLHKKHYPIEDTCWNDLFLNH